MESNLYALRSQDPLIYAKNLVFSHGNVGKPITGIADAKFSRNVYQNIYKQQYRTIFAIQKYSWNEILEGKSIVMINSRGTGKTFGYLPSLLTLIGQNPVKKPTAIIFVKTSREMEEINILCNRLLTEPRIKIVYFHGIWNLEDKVVQLLDGCDLLVTTPACYMRIRNEIYFNSLQFKRVVFDNFDTMYDTFKDELSLIFKSFLQESNGDKIQLIVTTKKWNEILRPLFVRSQDNVLIIGDLIEAAVMAKTEFQINVEKEEVMGFKLANTLETSDWSSTKTMIIFNNHTDILEFETHIKDTTIAYRVLSNVTNREAQIICKAWLKEAKGRMTLLLTTDDDLQSSSTDIRQVQVLIHYSLPLSWIKMSRRFYACIDHYKNFIDVKGLSENDERPKTIMLLNSNNIYEDPHPRLFHFLQNRKRIKQLSPDVSELLEKINRSIEKQRKKDSIQLCTNFLKFGVGIDQCSCGQRHQFIPSDKAKSDELLCEQVKFQILRIFNPLYYSIIITQTKKHGCKEWVSLREKNECTQEALKELQNYMNDEREGAGILKTGELYCVPFLNEWCRCRVISIKEIHHTLPSDVTIQIIDKGDKLTVKSNIIRHLPSKYKKYSNLATELRITNLAPFDFDSAFDPETINKCRNELYRAMREEHYAFCSIVLSFNSTIITENLFLFKYLKHVNMNVPYFDLQEYLLENKLAVKNDAILEKVKKVFEIGLNDLQATSKEEQIEDTLSCDT